MRKKISILCFAVLLALSSVLPVMAEENGEMPVSVASACWADGTFMAYVHPEDGYDITESDVGIMVNNSAGSEKVKFQTLFESGQPVRYMFLIDLSTSMPQYGERIEAFAESLIEHETQNVQITIGGFGEQFVVLKENLTNMKDVESALQDIVYDHEATDIGGGVTEALKYLSGQYKTGEGPVNLIVLSDGIPYLSDDDDDNQEGIRKTAQEVKKSIEEMPEIILHTVGFAYWDETMINALSEGSGEDVSAYSVQGAAYAAGAIRTFVASLYVAQIPFSWDFNEHRMDMQLMLTEEDTMGMYLVPMNNVANANLIEEMNLDNTPKIKIDKGESGSQISETGERIGETQSKESQSEESQTVESETTAESTKETEQTLEEEKKDTKSNGFIVPLCIAGILLLAIIIFLIIRSSKSKKETKVQGSDYEIIMKLDVVSGNCKNKNDRVIFRDEVIIVRSSSCDIVFEDESVAPQNSRIFLQDNLIYIENISDEKGVTCLGGMKIYAPNRLRSGDEISVGNVKFVLRF